MGISFASASSRYVSLPNSALLSPGTGVFTIVMMFRSSDACAAQMGLLSNLNDDGTKKYHVKLVPVNASGYFPAGALQLGMVSSNGNYVYVTTSATSWNNGAWHVATLVRTAATTLAIYIDGTTPAVYNSAAGTLADVDVSAGRAPTIGAMNDGGGSYSMYYNGDIGFIRILKGVAYDATMAKAAWQLTLMDRYRQDAESACWPMYGGPEGGAVSSVQDTSVNGLHGSPVNSPVYCAAPVMVMRQPIIT